MRFRLLVGSFLVAAVIAGCAGPPPTVIYIVISPTPADVTEVASTPSAAPTESSQAVAALPSATVVEPSLTATPQDTNTPTSVPTIAATPLPPTVGPTALPPSFATPTIAQI